MDAARDGGTAVPEVAELLGRARAMVPRLAARAREAEAERRVHAETIAEMEEAGFFRVLQPRRWGGWECDPGTYYDILMTLAEGCMSTAWIYGVVGVHPWFLALFDDRAAAEVWGRDRATRICSSLNPAGKAVPAQGGFRLSGRWRYASGCDHCDWIYLGGIAPGDPPDVRIFLLPRRDYAIVDTWHVSGLKATGSHDIVVDDAFVPEHRTRPSAETFNGIAPGLAVNDAPLYRIPMGQLFFRGISASAVGALKGMLDAFLDYGAARVSAHGARTAQDPMAQMAVAEAAAGIDEMKGTLHRNVRHLVALAARGERPSLALRVQYKFQSSWAVERAAQMAYRLFTAAGGDGLFADRPFGRIVDDINAARQHLSNQSDRLGRAWGQMLLGGAPPTDMVL